MDSGLIKPSEGSGRGERREADCSHSQTPRFSRDERSGGGGEVFRSDTEAPPSGDDL